MVVSQAPRAVRRARPRRRRASGRGRPRRPPRLPRAPIGFLQHERIIHLLVTLAVCAFLLLGIGFVSLHPSLPGLGFVALLLVLASAYLVHYFRLENGVQRLYILSHRIDLLDLRCAARYDGERSVEKIAGETGDR